VEEGVEEELMWEVAAVPVEPYLIPIFRLQLILLLCLLVAEEHPSQMMQVVQVQIRLLVL
jgi:hypothetical protein